MKAHAFLLSALIVRYERCSSSPYVVCNWVDYLILLFALLQLRNSLRDFPVASVLTHHWFDVGEDAHLTAVFAKKLLLERAQHPVQVALFNLESREISCSRDDRRGCQRFGKLACGPSCWRRTYLGSTRFVAAIRSRRRRHGSMQRARRQ